jgi:tRNA-specific 2-thiouridylase
MIDNKLKVFVGVSGGVDSSVALLLLQKATPNNFSKLFGRPTPKGFSGYDVTGVFLKVWNPDFLPCNWREERRSAMRVCSHLGVPFKTLDCQKEYKEKIVDYMISEYKAGRTPNPDVFCNKYIKFGIFLDKAIKDGADFVATGHYGQVEKENDEFKLLEATDKEKDQSYFLSRLGQKELSKILLPIGHLKKPKVRDIAKRFNLPTAQKKDSQGLCFIGKVDMTDFLKHYIDEKKGDLVDQSGEVIGSHRGVMFYTIGQRHGFDIFKKTNKDSRLFVIKKDIEKNILTLGEKKLETESGDKIMLEQINWTGDVEPDLEKTYLVCFRYHQDKQKSKIIKEDDRYFVIPEKKQFDVASGQIAVIYDEDICVGSGIIV